MKCEGERALRACGGCQTRPRLYAGGSPHRVVVVCPGCWDLVESSLRGLEGIHEAVDAWNSRQAELRGVERHCGICQLWGSSVEPAHVVYRRCLRRGDKYWETRTFRHMGLECPHYRVQVGREGER